MADTPPETHVLVLTDSAETAQLVPSLLEQAEGLRVSAGLAAGGQALQAVAQHGPQVVVLADTIDDPALIIAELDAAAPEIPQLVILPEGDTTGVEACSLAGARVTLMKPFEQQRLIAAVRQVHARVARHRQQLEQLELASGAAPAPRLQRPRVVAIHGAKGGMGTTTIAANLAAALHGLTGRRVAVVDADLLSGDAGVLFDLAPARSISELVPQLQELDAETVDAFFVRHPCGVHVLLAPEQLQRAEAIQAEDVQRVLGGLRPYFDYQIVDTPSYLLPVTLAVLDEADLIVLVVTPELVALRNGARFLRLAAQLGIPNEKILLVANRVAVGGRITVGMIEEHLHRRITAAVPADWKAPTECVNTGELLVDAYPRHRVAESIQRLARDVATHFGWTPPAGGPVAGPTSAAGRGPGAAVPSVVQRLARWLSLPGRSAAGNQ